MIGETRKTGGAILLAAIVAGCNALGYFEQAPLGPQCDPGETRDRAGACGVCDRGALWETCGDDRRWHERAADPCVDPDDGDDDGFANNDCGPGVVLDCNDDDVSVHPSRFDCLAGAEEDCDTECGSTGSRTCDDSCEWSACAVPAEACANGVDDDCDTLTDELEEGQCRPGAVVACTSSCGSAGTGLCTEACLAPASDACTPPAEVCNNLDDDCDTLTDNGFACVPRTSVACTTSCGTLGSGSCTDTCELPAAAACTAPDEECNGVDDDCDTGIDEDFACVRGRPTACTTTCGTTGSTTCTDACELPTDGSCEPPTEACGNGVDDDCDGETDELTPEQCEPGAAVDCATDCGSTGSGICSELCLPPEGIDCVPPGEECNAADDDCDGLTDDGFVCARGMSVACNTSCDTLGTGACTDECALPAPAACTPPAETCNGRDDDCDTVRDEDFDCVRGTIVPCRTTCGTTGSGICTPACEAPDGLAACTASEQCGNGVDDDCDTATDEPGPGECAPGTTVACTTTCGTTGSGTCTAGCLPPAPASCTPPAETCNAVDDDCDGATDETYACIRSHSTNCTTTCGSTGSGTCTSSCNIPAPASCTPPAETCNGADDDCVGGPDNGFPCVRGATGVDCTTTCGSTGTGTCTAACTLPTGTACTPPIEICNGSDDDCDGQTDEAGGVIACRPGTTRTSPTCSSCTQTCTGSCTWGDCVEYCNGLDDNCSGITDEGCGCLGGWQRVTGVPTTRNLRAIGGTAWNNIYATGDSGTILHYDGSSWTAMTSGTTDTLWTVGWGRTTGTHPVTTWFAGGNGGRLLELSGTTWTSRCSGLGSNVHGLSVFSELLFPSGTRNTVWMVGQSGYFASRVGTGACTSLAACSGLTGNLYEIAPINGGGYVFVGYSGVIRRFEPPSGCYAETSSTTRHLKGVHCASGDCLAVGEVGTILERPSSSTWTAVTSGTTQTLEDVWFASSTPWRAVAVGTNGTIREQNGTASWASSYFSGTEDLNAVWGSDRNDIWIGGESGTILHRCYTP
ncbi:MAG: hypothetical protein JXB32_16280 [Deltaproteobacteria bacterium]|nr:hypothetical protein [Deltaproteobacteria bacterium]